MNTVTEESPRITNPDGFKIQLREHQKAIIHNMIEIEKHNKIVDENTVLETRIGILSDKTGSGKTLEILGLIASGNIPSSFKRFTSFSSHNFQLYHHLNLEQDDYTSNLVIVPHTIIHQWTEALSLTNIKYYEVKNKKDIRYYDIEKTLVGIPNGELHIGQSLQIDQDNSFKPCSLAKINDKTCDVILAESGRYLNRIPKHRLTPIPNPNYNKRADSEVILVSDKFVGQFYSIYGAKWSRIIIDEPHMCKLNGSFGKELKSKFVWMMCATPYSLVGGVKKYLNNFLGMAVSSYGFMSDITRLCVSNKEEFVDFCNQLPEYKIVDIKCLVPAYLRILARDIPERALNALQAESLDSAIELLGCKSTSKNNIVSVCTEYYQTKIHNINANIDYIKNLILEEEDKNTRINNLVKEKDRLEQRANGIKSRLEEFLNDKDGSCPICCDSYKNPMTSPCCTNIFCMECLLQSFNHNPGSCPFCRAPTSLDQFYAISEKECKKQDNSNNNNKLINKIDNLAEIVNGQTDKKFIVVSRFDESFTKIENKLRELNITFSQLKGSTATIRNIISDFSSGNTKILLLNSDNYGSGMNLQMATDIVIYHKLNHNIEKQVIGRAQRPGRTCPLTVTYLKYDTEY